MCAAARIEGIHSIDPFTNSVGQGALVHHMAEDRRTYARLPLSARVRVKRVAGRPEAYIQEFEGMDISCGGVRFRADRNFQPGTEVDLEIILLDRPNRGVAIKMFTAATVIRSDALQHPGDHGVSAVFTDIAISRDAVR